MHVFVVGTGRCGTCTFYQAARHITNFTAGHETKAGCITDYTDYPDNHIEVSGPAMMSMGLLLKRYPDAKWVHLIRDRESCVQSHATQSAASMDDFVRHWRQAFQVDPMVAAGVFYDCVNANIEAMLPAGSLMIRLEDAAKHWKRFWGWIGADGDYSASVAEWSRKYNPTGNRGRDNYNG